MIRFLRLDAAQGASEKRTKLYLNTVKEYRSWQRRDAPKATAVQPAIAGWQADAAQNLNSLLPRIVLMVYSKSTI